MAVMKLLMVVVMMMMMMMKAVSTQPTSDDCDSCDSRLDCSSVVKTLSVTSRQTPTRRRSRCQRHQGAASTPQTAHAANMYVCSAIYYVVRDRSYGFALSVERVVALFGDHSFAPPMTDRAARQVDGDVDLR